MPRRVVSGVSLSLSCLPLHENAAPWCRFGNSQFTTVVGLLQFWGQRVVVSMAESKLLELFEKVSKAARKACNLGNDTQGTAVVDASEETRCTDALKAIGAVEVSTSLLLSTQVGKRLRKLTKHSSMKISKSAQDLLQNWKKVVSAEANSSNSKKLAPKKKLATLDSAVVSLPVPAPKMPPQKSTEVTQIKLKVKVTKTAAPEAASVVAASTTSSSSPGECRAPEIKLGPIPKAPGDSSRDRIREMLVDALAKVGKEATGDDLEKAKLINVVEVAVAVENMMFAKLGLSKGKEKAKYRSIMFNIKDDKNPDFRRQILLGKIKLETIVTMTSDDMASNHRKKETKDIKEKAMFECERGIHAMASTDQFKCHKCLQRKTTYFQMQTRSADEPMTTFVTCINCNAHWKF